MEQEAPPELTKAPTKSQEMAMLTKRLAQARDGVIARARSSTAEARRRSGDRPR